MTFYGTYEHAMDERGRLAVPAAFRRDFGAGGVLRPSVEGCIELYTSEGFEAEAARRLSGEEESSRTLAARRTRRQFMAEAFAVELDRQGRIVVPAPIRATTGLDGRAVVVGCGDYLEVWEYERWLAEQAALRAAEAEALQ